MTGSEIAAALATTAAGGGSTAETAADNIILSLLEASSYTSLVTAMGVVTTTSIEQEIEDYLTANGIPGDFATPAEFLAADDTLMLNGESVMLAHVGETITPDGSENVAVDCSLSLAFVATIDDDADISAITNAVENVPYVLKLTASGAGRAVTATGADETVNFGSGVTITSGKTGVFVIWLNEAADKVVQYTGETD